MYRGGPFETIVKIKPWSEIVMSATFIRAKSFNYNGINVPTDYITYLMRKDELVLSMHENGIWVFNMYSRPINIPLELILTEEDIKRVEEEYHLFEYYLKYKERIEEDNYDTPANKYYLEKHYGKWMKDKVENHYIPESDYLNIWTSGQNNDKVNNIPLDELSKDDVKHLKNTIEHDENKDPFISHMNVPFE